MPIENDPLDPTTDEDDSALLNGQQPHNDPGQSTDILTLSIPGDVAEQAQGLLSRISNPGHASDAHHVVNPAVAPPQQPSQPVAPVPQQDSPLIADLRARASQFPASPEQIAAFKQANPGIAESGYSDAEIGERLSMIMAWQATSQPGQQPSQAGGAPPSPPGTPAAPEPRRYSLWNDITGMPRAVASGIVKSGLETYDAVNEIVFQNEANHSQWRQGFERYYSNISGASSVAATIAQWGAAFVGISKFAKAMGVARAATRTGQIGQAAVAGAGADFLAFDGHDARLSDLIQNNPILGDQLANPINAYLASNPNDSEAEGRLKHALEGLGIGATVDVVLAGIRAMRARRAGDVAGAEAAQSDAIRRFNELNDAPRDDFNVTDVPAATPRPNPAASVTSGARATDATGEAVSAPGGGRGDAGTAGVATDAPPPPQQSAPPTLTIDEASVARAADSITSRVSDPELPFVDPGPRVPTPSTFDSLTHEGDLRAIVDTVEQNILRNIEGSQTARGPIPVQESQRLAQQFAEMTGQEPGIFLQRFARDSDNATSLHARLLAYDHVVRSTAADLRDMALAVRSREPGAFGTQEALEAAFHQRIASYSQMQDWLKGIRSETGRTLALMRHSREAGTHLGDIDAGALARGRLDGQGDTAAAIADRIISAGANPTLTNAALDPSLWARNRDAVVTLFIRSILSGPVTHLRNLVGNAYATLSHPAHKIIGGALPGGDRKLMAEGMQQYAYIVSEAVHGARMAAEAFKRGHNILDPSVTSLGVPVHRDALTAQAVGLNPSSWSGWMFDSGARLLDAVSTRALTAGDEFFKQVSFAAEVDARAWSRGVQQGLEGDALTVFVARERNAAFQEDFAGLQNVARTDTDIGREALDVARGSTFTTPVRPNTVASHILDFTNSYPTTKLVVPFVRVIDNLMRYSASMTPGLANLTQAYRMAIEAGGREAAVAKGRLATGWALWTSAAALAQAGYITGPGPSDPQQRQALQQTGWKPNAIRVGDTYLSLNGFDPLGLPFNIAGALSEAFQRAESNPEETFDTIAGAMTLAIAQNLTDRHYLRGISDLLKAVTDRDGHIASRYAGNLASTILVPNAVRTITTANDPIMREARGFVESLMRRTPGLSEGLAARRMPWGERMTLPSALASTRITAEDDPLLFEYGRQIEMGNRGTPEPLPRTKAVPGQRGIDMATFRLNNGRLLYDAYGDLIQRPDPNAPSLRDALTQLIKSPGYKNQLIDGPGTLRGTRLHAMRQIIQRYRTSAWRQILERHPEVYQRAFQARQSVAERASTLRRSLEAEVEGIE